jgi:drug/metabolite transporter (DMT)-like permease
VQSLLIGLVAALMWGLHDFSVRKVSGRADISVLVLMSLAFGAAILSPLAIVVGGWDSLTPQVTRLAVLSGAAYAVASFSLYKAFVIGPVRLVAPICGAYPLLSVSFSILRGHEATALVWLGAVAVIGGIALVARGEGGTSDGNRLHAMGWAALSAIGFATTFGTAQWAAENGADLLVSLVARLCAAAVLLTVVKLRRPPIGLALAQWRLLMLMGALDVGALTLVTIAGGFESPAYASVTSSTFGMVTILLAWRFLGEAMRPLQWMGVAAVFAGIAILGVA